MTVHTPTTGAGILTDAIGRECPVYVLPMRARRRSAFAQLSIDSQVAAHWQWLAQHPAAAATLVAMVILSDHNNLVPACNSRVAAYCGISRQAVTRSLQLLNRAGHIARHSRVGAAVTYMVSPYLVSRVSVAETRRLQLIYDHLHDEE